ncbi:helix-turn-helix domain-containing protein [Pollutibacter soli]|uniref:helix-turn-helix domain-containing protein n=1 Tax=Pollutibacter soli TaxID=3034157 RepID=UPI003013D2E6
MIARHLLPSEKISAYVDRILVIQENQVATPFVLPLYANGVPTILFTSAKGKLRNGSANHLHLFGQTIVPDNISLKKEFILIAYFFKPYSLISLFGVQAHELTDHPLDLHLLFPKRSRDLENRLVDSGDAGTMIEMLDEFIFYLINHAKNDCERIKYAANRIMHDYSKESLVTVQKELHITERTFQRLFEKNIGVAPGMYRRICQFNASFTSLNNRRHLKLSDLAYQYGYADQSHYIRAFKEFTNITPGEYLKFGS